MSSNGVKSRKRAASVKKSADKKPRNDEAEEQPQTVHSDDSDEEFLPTDEPKKAAPSTSKKAKKPKTTASASTPAAPKAPNRSVLQLKISLDDVVPPIWRRIQVLNNITFAELRSNINEAMGWRSSRSHQFIIRNPKKPNKNILIVDGMSEFNQGRSLKEQNTKISRFLNVKGDEVMYEFDLGDSWMHHVVLERVLPPAPPKAWYPKIKGGKRACPPEDCGGVNGYKHLIQVYQDPEHAEYDELIKGWLDDMYPGYDPEKFERKNIFKKVWMWVMG